MGDSVHQLVRLWSWVDGGTALTNFSPKEEPIYLAAIEAFGDPNYVVAHAPMAGPYVIPTDYSLHRLDIHNMPKRDSGPFWRVFEEIRKANAKTMP